MYHPQTAFVVLTTDCNRHDVCAHCFYNVQPDRLHAEQPDTKTVIELLKKLRLSGIGSVIFTGGEPALREDLPRLVKSAIDMSLQVLLLTNGLLLTEELVRQLEKAGLDTVIMSISRVGKKEADAAERIVASGKIDLSFIFCITKANFEMIRDVEIFAKLMNAGMIFQPAYIPEGHELEETLSLRKIHTFDLSKIYTMLLPWAKKSRNLPYLKMIYDYYSGESAGPPRCAVAGNALVVDADGSMYPCFHRRDLCCGSAFGDEFSTSMAALSSAYSELICAPCFGEHCISLYTGL